MRRAVRLSVFLVVEPAGFLVPAAQSPLIQVAVHQAPILVGFLALVAAAQKRKLLKMSGTHHAKFHYGDKHLNVFTVCFICSKPSGGQNTGWFSGGGGGTSSSGARRVSSSSYIRSRGSSRSRSMLNTLLGAYVGYKLGRIASGTHYYHMHGRNYYYGYNNYHRVRVSFTMKLLLVVLTVFHVSTKIL